MKCFFCGEKVDDYFKINRIYPNYAGAIYMCVPCLERIKALIVPMIERSKELEK